MSNQYAVAGEPVVFVEHSAVAPVGVRLDRWHAAVDPRFYGVPWVMVDSGYRASGGEVEYEMAYREMIEPALARPPGAEVSAWYERHGSTGVHVEVQVVNRSGVMWTEEQEATVNVIVYERRRLQQTARFARASTVQSIGALNDGESVTHRFFIADVPMTDWTKAMVLALVDYRPDPHETQFEALQAAHASEGPPTNATSTPTPSATATETLTGTPSETSTESPSETPTEFTPPTATTSPTETATPSETPTEAATPVELTTETATAWPSPVSTTPPPSKEPPSWVIWLPFSLG